MFSKFIHSTFCSIVVLIFSILLFSYAIFYHSLSAPSNSSETKTIEIKPGGIDSIADTLYEEKMIRSRLSFILYTKLRGKNSLKAATYVLSRNMSVEDIVKILSDGNGQDSAQITITFKEGWNIRKITKAIRENTNHSEEDVYNTLKDDAYLKSLISKYWFLTDDILDSRIYYPLEGYLYPETYNFSSKDVEVKKIIETMLLETEKKLKDQKEKILSSHFSVHEIFTLASIAELEGNDLDDRKKIVQVFQNRMQQGMNLGSDVTTYYGARVDMGDRDLYTEEVNACNSYNTRCASFKTLPVSPICNPSIVSILAVIEPDDNDYLYFVADKNKKIYFSKTLKEHNATISRLKEKNLWLEY